MKAMRCDRCKKFYVITDRSVERPELVGKHIFAAQVIDAFDNNLQKFDLCTDCAIEVYNYLNNILIEAPEELSNEDILLVSREIKADTDDTSIDKKIYFP